MKRIFLILLCVCLLVSPAMAVELSDYAYITETGETAYDYDAYYAAVAREKVDAAGLSINVDAYWVLDDYGVYFFDRDTFELDYTAALAAQEGLEESEVTQDETVEPASSETVDEPASSDVPAADEQPSSSDPVVLEDLSSVEEEPVSSEPETVVPDEVVDDPGETVAADEGSETHTYNVLYASADLGVSDTDTAIISGLKSVIVSIFGEYEPVMTTGTVTETVDGVTTTTLYDTVAEGAAGVDYEWLAGVFLFGILLFCLMRLLGGILK